MLGPCFLNRSVVPAGTRQRRLLDLLSDPDGARAAVAAMGAGMEGVIAGAQLADNLARDAQVYARRLAAGMSVPVVPIPLVATRPGLAATRAIVAALEPSA